MHVLHERPICHDWVWFIIDRQPPFFYYLYVEKGVPVIPLPVSIKVIESMSRDKLILVHLSDIHFSKSSGGVYDPDKHLRKELENDAAQVSKMIGTVDGVLVTGDIAFSGKKEEYKIAIDWLYELCETKIGCRFENVWVSPGNHDVDRDVIRNSGFLKQLHASLRSCEIGHVDAKIKELMEDTPADLLFKPIENYNRFALNFGCDINPHLPYWQDNLTLNDGSTLRLRGMNSTLVSNDLDDKGENKLILGTVQANFWREEGVSYLILCHHPSDWLFDWEHVEPGLNAHARLQLYGHKHKQVLSQVGDTVRIVAGAVHPAQGERNWQPRYNWLTVSVTGENDNRTLNLHVYPRVWSPDEQLFMADYDSSGSERRSFILPLENWSLPSQGNAETSGAAAEPDLQGMGEGAIDETGKLQVKRSATMNPVRRLAYCFFNLPYHVIIKIAQELELLEDQDQGQPDQEKLKRFLQREGEKDILAQLCDAVEECHGFGDTIDNPFRK